MLKIKEIRKSKNLSQDDLVALSGIKKRSFVAYENGETDIPLSKLQNIAKSLDVSIFDLIDDESTVISAAPVEYLMEKQAAYKRLGFNIVDETKEAKIPLVHQTAIARFGNEAFIIKEEDVKEYYVVPMFKHSKVDFMIEVRGDSMYPKYSSGDIIACAIINESQFIQWNKAHFIATKEQGTMIKRIHASEGEILKMVSDNDKYPPFDVPKSEITGIAIIIGVIRLD